MAKVNKITQVYIVCSSKYAIPDTDMERMYDCLTSAISGATKHNIQICFLGNNSVSAKSITASTIVKSWKNTNPSFTPFKKRVHKAKYLVVFRKSFREPDKLIQQLRTANKKATLLAI